MYNNILSSNSTSRSKETINTISDIFFIGSFISINLGYNEIAIIFIIYTFLIQFNRVKIHRKIIQLLLPLLLSGSVISLISIQIYDIDQKYFENIFLRNRFFIIRILYALSVAVYMYRLSKLKILNIIYIVAMLNIIVGLFQFFSGIFSGEIMRIKMLSFEPSSAAMFYVFAVPLLLQYSKDRPSVKKYTWLFIFSGLLISSKAQLIILLLWSIIFIYRSKKKILWIIPILAGLFIIISPYLLGIKQVNSIIHFVNVFYNEGITGLNPENQIWTSFTLRTSSAFAAFELFSKNIFGIGFGLFHPLYINYMNTSIVGLNMTGEEISSVLINHAYATPKASMTELIVSCGLFFIIPLIIFVKSFFNDQTDYFVKLSLVSVLIIGFMVELAPFLTYLIILHLIKSKNIE